MIRLVDPIAHGVLDAAIRWTVPFALVWLIVRARPLSAATRYHLWTWLIAGLLILPLATASLPEWRVSKPATLQSAELVVATRPPASGHDTAPLAASTVGSRSAPRAVAGQTAPPALVPEPSGRRATAYLLGITRVLPWAWAIVAVGLLMFWAAGQIAVHRIAASCEPACRSLRDLLRECTQRIGIQRSVALLVAADDLVPMTWGTLRPVIVLPAASRSWPREQLRRVLLHEVAHVGRMDSFTHAMSRVACALFWFHPAVWHVARALRQEAESACDDQVVGAGISTLDYAGDLLRISRALRPGVLSRAALPMAQPSGLEQRIRRLLDHSRRRGVSRRSAAACLLAVVCALAAIGGLRWAERNDAGDWLRAHQVVDDRAVWSMDCGSGDDPVCAQATRRALALLERADRPGVVVVQRVATGEIVTYAAVRPSESRADAVPLVLPGSVAKLGLAALWWESGMGDPSVPCPARTETRSGRTITNAGARDLGSIPAPRGMLVESCNTAAAIMTDALERRLGSRAAAQDLSRLGFGAPGVGLSADIDPHFWAPRATEQASGWSIPHPRFYISSGDADHALVAAALGLGEGGTTPLHVSRFLQTVGNRGVMLPPRPIGWAGPPPRGVRLLGEHTTARLREAMLAVVREGTAARTMPQLEWSRWVLGGKTGTVPASDGPPNGWFAGLAHAPDGRPVYTIVVLVENGGTGGGVPAGIAAEMTRLFARVAGDEL